MERLAAEKNAVLADLEGEKKDDKEDDEKKGE